MRKALAELKSLSALAGIVLDDLQASRAAAPASAAAADSVAALREFKQRVASTYYGKDLSARAANESDDEGSSEKMENTKHAKKKRKSMPQRKTERDLIV